MIEATSQGQETIGAKPTKGSAAAAINSAGNRDQRVGGEGIEPDLEKCVPAGVAERREKHGGKNEGVHLTLSGALPVDLYASRQR